MKAKTEFEVKVDKGIPLPNHRCKPSRYPIIQLEPGDSFFVKDLTTSGIWNEISRVKTQFSDKRSFAVRAVDGGVRVWRTK